MVGVSGYSVPTHSCNFSCTMQISLVESVVVGTIGFLIVVLLNNFRLIRIALSTLPRDVRGAKSFFLLETVFRYAKARNRTVFQVFDSIAVTYPDKVCFYFEDETWTFRQVQEHSNRIANYFSENGFEKGDMVAFIMENRPEYVSTWIGLSKIGVIPSLISASLRQESLKHALELLPHKAILFEGTVAEGVKGVISLGYGPQRLFCAQKGSSADILDDLQLDVVDLDAEVEKQSSIFSPKKNHINFDDALCHMFTSGTTGMPKAALIRHSRFFVAGLSSRYLFKVEHADIQYSPLPLYHITGGILGLGSAIFTGTSVVLRRKFSASQFWTDCVKYNVTVAQYIGETVRYLHSQPPSENDRAHQVRKLIGLGLRGDLWSDTTSRFGIENIREMYGSTEGNCAMVNLDGRPGACGFMPRWAYHMMPYKLVKVSESGEIVRDRTTGNVVLCDVNEPGELIGRIYPSSPLRNFEGYSDRAATEQKIIRNAFSHGDSYFRTGDLMSMDEQGYFYFRDRSGDTFRWKGENTSTQQVELVISRICNLTDVAVFGVQVPHTEGKAGMAVIVKEAPFDLDHFASEVRQRLPAYSRPLFVRLVQSLEFTSTHKVKKAELQKEGFHIGPKVQDSIYFLAEDRYTPLTEGVYKEIMAGRVRL